MKISNPVESVVALILDNYGKVREHEYGIANDFARRYEDEMSEEQKKIVSEARAHCEQALEHPMRHFNGGLSSFSPY
ncbi:TPA: hypothetical protein P8L14_004557 [Yersinia enterocolitica]|jgi:hypothetical protein|nr:hypothetical protein [Yersinia enterocolitica]